MNKYNQEQVNFLSKKDYLKEFEKIDLKIVFSILHAKKDKIYSVFVSKHNSNQENQVVLLMISNGKRWPYFLVEKLSKFFFKQKQT